jgi:hypothetical protein
MRRALLLLVALLAGTAARAAGGPARNVALVLDTSSSMVENDPQRYTLQVSQIVADLLDDGDSLSVVRMPRGGLFTQLGCSGGPSSELALRTDGSARATFKSGLDDLVSYDTGTFFVAPIRTALAALAGDRRRPRLLLVVADSGGLGSCAEPLTRELLALRREGATLAAINLGNDAGAFDGNPAFDLTVPARNPEELTAAVARVYQRFLGGRSVSTGSASGRLEVEIAPYVREAFVVLAADGPLAPPSQAPGNPGAVSVDLDFRGGGGALGLDGRRREYRIVRLAQPASGRWRFDASGLGAPAGWMLIQDSSLGLRLRSPALVAAGVATTLEAQLVDETTGAVIADAPPGLTVNAEVEGRTLTLRDDGSEGDAGAGDGVFSAGIELHELGRHEVSLHLASDLLDRHRSVELDVIEGAWRLTVRSPGAGRAGAPLELAVEAVPIGSAARLVPPTEVEAIVGGVTLDLRPAAADAAGNPRYAARWSPDEPGTFTVQYRGRGGSQTEPASAPIAIAGVIELGQGRPIVLAPLHAGGEGGGTLAFPAATVRGAFTLAVTTDFARRNAMLEVDPGTGWVALGAAPVTLPLGSNQGASWPLRLRVAACPQAAVRAERFTIRVREAAGGQSATVPLSLSIAAEPWLVCWWPVLALGATVAVVAVGIHGYASPSRFAPRLGVCLSPEVDLAEGFFHPIRAVRGTGSGFYRDAAVYVCRDFRLAAKGGDALARLRAKRGGVHICPAPGAAVFRQTAEGGWEELPAAGSSARAGTLYRNESASLFFEVRQG